MSRAPYYQDEAVTIYHGDCREVLGTFEVRSDIGAVVADPPYGETSLEWDRWPLGWPSMLATALSQPVSLWCFGSLRMFLEHSGEFAMWDLAQDLIWEKHNGSGFASDRFKRVHEYVVQWYRGAWTEVFKSPVMTHDATARTVKRSGQTPHTGEIGEVRNYTTVDDGPRLMRSVIEVRSCNGYAEHPTQKPTGIVLPLIEYSVALDKVVLDPFMGSGTTLRAAKDLGRKAIGIEIDERYCEVAAKRMAQEVLAI